MSFERTVPTGWDITYLEEVVDILDSKRVPINAKERETRVGQIPYYGATGQVGWIDDYLFDEELVLLGEDGAPFLDAAKQKAYVVRGKSWVNNHAHVLRARSDIPNAYIKYYLDTVDYHEFVTGTTRLKLNQAAMRRIPVPLAPPEQRARIVAEIEKQFSRLDEAVANLKRVRANLKRYKASILKAAVEGKLTEDWRKQHPDVEPASKLLERILAERRKKWSGRGNYKEPIAPEVTDLPSLPKGWAWATVDQVAAPEPNSITDGPFGSNLKTEHYKMTGPRVIRLQNIGDGVFVNEEAHISEEHFAHLQKHRVFAGDLVIAALGEDPPRSCLIPQSVGPAIVKADCIRFKPHKDVGTQYLNVVLNSQPIRQRAKSIVHGVGRPRLNLGEIKAIVVPVPSTVEQQTIVAEVESRLSVIKEIEAAVEANLTRADRLRQSILSQAFSGKLSTVDAKGNDQRSTDIDRARA